MLGLPASGVGFRQAAVGQRECLLRQSVGEGTGAFGRDSLRRVCEHVHARVGGDMGRHPSSREASSMAPSGRRPSSTSGYFTPWSVSVRTAKEVTSLPVPAVVGIHHRGGWRSENQHIPLAQSIGEPPPRATTASGPKSRSIRTPWATRRREGSGSTWSKISTAPVRRFYPVQETGRGQERVCNDEDPLPRPAGPARPWAPVQKIEFGLDPKRFPWFLPAFSLMRLVWQVDEKYSSGGKFSAGAANITQGSIHRMNFPLRR